jgi:uncharacterized protein with HEPN domain
MPSSDDKIVLNDIWHNIELAELFVAGLDLQAFLNDVKTFYAATRCLEIISEASRRLSQDFKQRFPHIEWKKMAGSGSIYRHDYEDVLERLVWQTIHQALPPLREIVEAELSAG